MLSNSNNIFNAVSIFDGKHWLVWSGTMESYLEHQGISYVLTETVLTEVKATDGSVTNASEIRQWKHDDLRAKGSIKLRLTEGVIANIPTANIVS
ncbi:unnamed protein product, partial [Mycena citricolor]